MLLTVDAALFEFKDERWNTRALAGALRLNQTADGQTRLVMRAKGSGKLLLNANLWPERTVSLMEGRGVTFAVGNHAGAPAAPPRPSDGQSRTAAGRTAAPNGRRHPRVRARPACRPHGGRRP